jgi:hypothetical protein
MSVVSGPTKMKFWNCQMEVELSVSMMLWTVGKLLAYRDDTSQPPPDRP